MTDDRSAGRNLPAIAAAMVVVAATSLGSPSAVAALTLAQSIESRIEAVREAIASLPPLPAVDAHMFLENNRKDPAASHCKFGPARA